MKIRITRSSSMVTGSWSEPNKDKQHVVIRNDRDDISTSTGTTSSATTRPPPTVLRKKYSKTERDSGTIQLTASFSSDTDENEHDDRPFIKDLLEKHSSTIEAVRKNVKLDPLYDEERYDDIWILRFVLSNKSVKASTKSAIATMKFREDYKLNEMEDCQFRIPNHRDGPYLYPCHQKFYEHCKGNPMIHCLHDEDRGIMVYLELFHVNLSTYAKVISKEDMIMSRIMISEGVYRVLDDITRRTGRLTKVCRVFDMEGFPLKSFDKDCLNLESETANLIQEFYPQSASAILVVEAPRWCGWVWKIAKPLLPYRVRDKFDFVYPKRSVKDRRKFLRHVALEHLPEKYGGTNDPWPPVRVRETSNLLY